MNHRDYRMKLSLIVNGYDSSQEPAFFNNVSIGLDCVISHNQQDGKKTLLILERTVVQSDDVFQTDFCFLNPQRLDQIPSVLDLDFESNDDEDPSHARSSEKRSETP